jgi:hypothetical protein
MKSFLSKMGFLTTARAAATVWSTLAVFLVAGSFPVWAVTISISESPSFNCLSTSWDDIEVYVDSESFDFSPSCNFSYSDSFKTNEGLNCNIDAAMCSSFLPHDQFVVTCDDGSTESMNVTCP